MGSADRRIGVLSPGAMGAAVAAAGLRGSTAMLWAGEGRGHATRARADAAGMVDVGTVEDLVQQSEIILSVCPPSFADDVADRVFDLGFSGTFVEANAIAPSTARAVAARAPAGVHVVDGGIVGPPPTRPGTTRLYLSGEGADDVAAVFAGGPLECIVLQGPVGGASALKVCYAANTKAGGALLMAIRALAVAEGVDDALVSEWSRSQPHALATSEGWSTASAPKAWRFVGEMQEIGDALRDRGLPDGFLRAAADIYARLERYKDTEELIPVDQLLEGLLAQDEQ